MKNQANLNHVKFCYPMFQIVIFSLKFLLRQDIYTMFVYEYWLLNSIVKH